MKKKALALLTATSMLFGVGGVLPYSSTGFSSLISASAATVASGKCGDNVSWVLDNSGTLTISGTGEMYNYKDYYTYFNKTPWYDYRSDIKKIIIQNGVTSIGEYAFQQCKSMTSITIPYGVTNIGKKAFFWCTDFESVSIPNSVTSIDESTFDCCTSLTNVTIPDSVTSIGDEAFYRCESLTSITIPDSVTRIGDDAFYRCTSLTSITIPDSVTSIGRRAFSDCISLTIIRVDQNNLYYCSENGVLFNKNKTTLIQYPAGNKIISYTIPDSVTSIGAGAFHCCEILSDIKIPDSVTIIGADAFEGCKSIEKLNIPNNVYTIQGYAFYNCSSLENVILGTGLKKNR